MKRLLDLLIATIILLVLAPVCLLIAIAIRFDSEGSALFWSKRFGRNGVLFEMPKFRTMRIDTPQLPTHQMKDGASHLTRIGGFLRRTSLDELPQLYSVLRGDMSLVGPRPALFNQDDLMALRKDAGVDALRPGITGWAQVNGRDELKMSEKVEFERDYLMRQSTMLDLRILFLTIATVLRRHGISH